MTTLPTITLREVCAGYEGFPTRDPQHHFDRGREMAGRMEYVTIAVNNVWGGRSKDRGSVSSYEKIGYHSGSVDFIVGVVSTGCPVYVYRDGPNGLTKYSLVAENPEFVG